MDKTLTWKHKYKMIEMNLNMKMKRVKEIEIVKTLNDWLTPWPTSESDSVTCSILPPESGMRRITDSSSLSGVGVVVSIVCN